MANQEVVSGQHNFILPGNREKASHALEAFRAQPPSVGSEEEYSNNVSKLIETFIPLCWKHLKVSRAQLQILKEEELRGLGDLLRIKAKKWHRLPSLVSLLGLITVVASSIYIYGKTALMFWILPVLGPLPGGLLVIGVCLLLIIQGPRESIYLGACKKLEKRYGKNYFPYNKVKKVIED
jgi:hypothetical protein